MKVLIFGSRGQLGSCLIDQLENKDHNLVCSSHEEVDIANFEETKNYILDISPDLIINAAAYTAVDKAEEDQEEANIINHLAVANIANICCELDCWLIHVSTDYVFDGNSKKPYTEDDKPNPQGVYGQTKLKGELAIQSSGCRHIIIRTSWVYSEYGSNFLKTVLRLGEKQDKLNIIGDQYGCPTYAQDIAKTIVKLLPKLSLNHGYEGIYHYCGNHACSWFEFANIIFDIASEFGFKVPKDINQIGSAYYPSLAARPKYSVLDCTKIESKFKISLSDLRAGVEGSLNRLTLSNK
jgi:dTDP-4-dehydrorhamnose reductase|tara:strand:- start:1975 stop:2859 length:885 start_codon:yes stop_codon:yes gene_type:complete